ncbi:DNA glycosylase [Chytriomyces sp. MP71]|nr:DNA glycosylase [Chytriomyces sp. MP71]
MMTQAPSRTHSLAYHAFSDEAAVMQLRCQLLAWYDANKRALPWRRAPSEWADADEHAYHTWVSEVMSQQTRVGTAAPYYTTWTTKWPTVAALADASLADVHAVWSGLGYYSRATRMLEAAKLIVHSHGGRFPRDAATLHSDIPGIGPYTAGAVASIAFNAHAPVVDGNVVRVLSRLRALGCDPKSKAASELHWSLAGRLLDVGRPGDFNQAVMEFGATVCTPQNPSCKGCPIKMHCRAHEEFFGVKEEKDAKEVSEQEERVERKKCAQCLPDIEDCVPPFPVTRYPAMVKKKAADEKSRCLFSISFLYDIYLSPSSRDCTHH